MNQLVAALRSGKVLLMDGAMGTELQRLTRAPSFEGYSEFNLTHPDLIRSIHRAYRMAGAEVFLTNTFQVNPSALSREHLADQHQEIWQAALQLAHDVAPGQHFILADIGPVESLTSEIVRELVKACRGADGILLETWTSLEALQQFAAAINERGDLDLPLLVSFTFHRDLADGELKTFEGVQPEVCAGAAVAGGAVALGANCGKDISMRDLAELAKRYRIACDLPLFVRPNAGTPTLSESGWVYPHDPQAMADALTPVLEAGVTMVGGCCGTTPDTIRAFGIVINAWNAARQDASAR